MHILWKSRTHLPRLQVMTMSEMTRTLKEGTCPFKEGQIGDETLNMNHPLNGRKSIPGGHPLLRALTSWIETDSQQW